MARRYLNLSPQEWDRLPWWLQRTYFDGYVWEELIQVNDDPEPDPTQTSERTYNGGGGTTITERNHSTTFSMVPGEMATFGFKERTL